MVRRHKRIGFIRPQQELEKLRSARQMLERIPILCDRNERSISLVSPHFLINHVIPHDRNKL